jgi:hypothetical protein
MLEDYTRAASVQHQRSCKLSMLDMVAARNNTAKIPPTISNTSIDHPWSECVARIKPGPRASFHLAVADM